MSTVMAHLRISKTNMNSTKSGNERIGKIDYIIRLVMTIKEMK